MLNRVLGYDSVDEGETMTEEEWGTSDAAQAGARAMMDLADN